MKLIRKSSTTTHGYWSNETTNYYYYLCDNEDEYKSMVDKCGKEFNISVTPNVEVSDGYAISGGKSFNAIGVREFKPTQVMHEEDVIYYIKPNSITNEKNEPTKGWWC